uniref:Putative enoyl-CoA hydratase/isomerase n=1 Tax=uncultured bacterium UPO50 TaxID=1776975 RepID=A0A126T051_9BACT|nr:putative enoyl-CoA hydratase/isomerase [uncultured bacterium UPO50]
MESDVLLFEKQGGIATLTLNRPASRNALSVALVERLQAAWRLLDADPEVRVIVLTSAECGTFCAGMDLKEAARIRAEEGVDVLSKLKDPFHEGMREVGKPIIVALNGDLPAGGLMLAVNADLRVGLRGTRAAITEAQRGRGSPWAVPLLWQMPQAVLMEMVFTGEWLPIERLHALGWINHLEDSSDAVQVRARQLAERIRDNAPLSVMAGKAALLRAASLGCDAGLAEAKRLYQPVYASEDAIEGPRAFAEKRQPIWKGR